MQAVTVRRGHIVKAGDFAYGLGVLAEVLPQSYGFPWPVAMVRFSERLPLSSTPRSRTWCPHSHEALALMRGFSVRPWNNSRSSAASPSGDGRGAYRQCHN